MTVTAFPKDVAGQVKQAAVTTLQTAVNKTANGPTGAYLAAELDKAQRELVFHFFDNGRLLPATVRTTMAPPQFPKDVDGARLVSNITNLQAALAKATGLSYSSIDAQLNQAIREYMAHCLDRGVITAANILSTLT